MTWTKDFDEKVTRIFELAISAADPAVTEDCWNQLLALGLSERQIDSGFMAAAVQIALDTGVDNGVTELFKEFQRRQPEDADVVLRARLPSYVKAG